jgi:CopA family copper-resistance protein
MDNAASRIGLKGLLIVLLFSPGLAMAKTVRYELTIRNESVNMSGKKAVDFALTVNGGIPAPTLEFTEGDDAEITVRNELKSEDVSIHWHGILLPPLEDGVPFVNTPPIYPGSSRTFKFPIRQSGTYWYHSHTMLQEQKGVFGAIVIHPKKETIKADREAVVVLSDWSDEDADQILRNLKKDGDYYLYKKGSMRSYFGAIKEGKLGNQLTNEWSRMGGMDLSDVGYDAFLVNGKRDSQLVKARAGERIRLRIVNAASSTYFHVSLGGGPMKVIAADGIDIEPIQANEILMGMAETYDVLFTVPENKNYELRATAQDGTGHASTFIGAGDDGVAGGEKVLARDVPRPDLYATMDHSAHGEGHANHTVSDGIEKPASKGAGHANDHDHMMGHHGMDHEMASHGEETPMTEASSKVVETLTVDELKALTPMSFPNGAKVHDLKLVLDGDMRRYVWHINGKVISQDRLLTVNPGEIVRITYENKSMMHHPMHLHGHFFRVLNESGDYSPLKHTVDVPPMGSRTIEFYADEVGQWMLHCHNLYHMDTGMARVVRYSNFVPQGEMAELEGHDHHLMDPWYTYGKAEISSNHMEGKLRLSQSWNEFSFKAEGANVEGKNFDYDFKDHWDYEGDLFYRRWFDSWTNLIVGGTSYGERFYGVVGVGTFLPLMIEVGALINHEGQFRLDVERKFQWTSDVFTDVDFSWRPNWKNGDHSAEVEVSLMYAPTWSWAAGLMLTNESLGAGLEYQF